MSHKKAWVVPFFVVLLTLVVSGLACGRRGRATQEAAQVATPTSVQVATQPPAVQPTADQPPADQPPADQLPAEPPPADDQPPVDQPPVDQLPDDQSPVPGLPVIDYFYAEASDNAGCYFLHWDLHDATAAFLNGEGVTAPNSMEVCPEVTTNYILHAENAAGSVEQTVTVDVAPPPEVDIAPSPVIIIPMQNLQARVEGDSIVITWVDGSNEADYILMLGEQEVVTLDAGTDSYVWVDPPCSVMMMSITLIARDADGAELGRLAVSTGTPPCPAQPQTVTLQSLPAEDGYVRGLDSGESVSLEGSIRVGDGTQNQQQQAFFSFDLSGIPRGATIQEATLDLSNHTLSGRPFSAAEGLGQLAYYTRDYGTLGVEDFVPTPLPAGAMLFDRRPSTLNVTSFVQWAVNSGSARFQGHLMFETPTNNNDQGDGLAFPEGGPALTITYMP